MTLLVALKGTDGLALAADSRGTFGDPRGVTAQNDSQQKAHILAPHVNAALRALVEGSPIGSNGSSVEFSTATDRMESAP
jgi:hypothetical protein